MVVTSSSSTTSRPASQRSATSAPRGTPSQIAGNSDAEIRWSTVGPGVGLLIAIAANATSAAISGTSTGSPGQPTAAQVATAAVPAASFGTGAPSREASGAYSRNPSTSTNSASRSN